MSDAEKILVLETRVNDLERQIKWLMLHNLTTINVLRGVISRNGLTHPVQVGEELVDPFERFGTIFDRIMALAEERPSDDR